MKKIIIKRHCVNNNEFNLLTRKSVFPYSFINNWEKLEQNKFPLKESFFCKLNNSSISNKDYLHARRVWETFNLKTLGEYTHIYFKTDVLLLSDIFENFRRHCLKTYNLDPLHYYTAPGFAFDAMLKFTKIELDTIDKKFNIIDN